MHPCLQGKESTISAPKQASDYDEILTASTKTRKGLAPSATFEAGYSSNNISAMVCVGVDLPSVVSVVDLLLLLVDRSVDGDESDVFQQASKTCSSFLLTIAKDQGYDPRHFSLQEMVSAAATRDESVFALNPGWTMKARAYHFGQYNVHGDKVDVSDLPKELQDAVAFRFDLDEPTFNAETTSAFVTAGANPLKICAFHTAAIALSDGTAVYTCPGHDIRVHGDKGWFRTLQPTESAPKLEMQRGAATYEDPSAFCGSFDEASGWPYRCRGHLNFNDASIGYLDPTAFAVNLEMPPYRPPGPMFVHGA